jgi:hypothetical protein
MDNYFSASLVYKGLSQFSGWLENPPHHHQKLKIFSANKSPAIVAGAIIVTKHQNLENSTGGFMSNAIEYSLEKALVESNKGVDITANQWEDFCAKMIDTLDSSAQTAVPTLITSLGIKEVEWAEFNADSSFDSLKLSYSLTRSHIEEVFDLKFDDDQWTSIAETTFNSLDISAWNDVEYILFELLNISR